MKRKIYVMLAFAALISLAYWQLMPRISQYFYPPHQDITVSFQGKHIIMMSSLPLRHKGAQSMADIVAGKGEDNPFYQALATDNHVEMVDNVFWEDDSEGGREANETQDFFASDDNDDSGNPPALNGNLRKADMLILAQSRTLTPDEFLAVDYYVRSGGHVVIFADPALHWTKWDGENGHHHDILTGKIQSVALFSPLFDHWRLAFLFEEGEADLGNGVVTFDAGTFAQKSTPQKNGEENGDLPPKCHFPEKHYIAICDFAGNGGEGGTIEGRALIIGDADILHPLFLGGDDNQTPFQRANRQFLSQFLAKIFP